MVFCLLSIVSVWSITPGGVIRKMSYATLWLWAMIVGPWPSTLDKPERRMKMDKKELNEIRAKAKEEPEANWHELTSYCTECKEKLYIQEILANSQGQLIFTLVCFKCSEKFSVEITIHKIVNHCFDMDFLTLGKFMH